MPPVVKASTDVAPDADARALLVYQGLKLANEHAGVDLAMAERRGFGGALGESLVCSEQDNRTIILVGLGEEKALDREALRRAGAGAARAAASFSHLAIDCAGLGLDVEQATSALGEGALLSAYRFTEFKSQSKASALAQISLVGADLAALEAGAQRASVVAEAVALARDLSNMPGGSLTPSRFAEIATTRAGEAGIGITVLDEVDIAGERLGGLLGVAQGSDEPPRMVLLSYDPPGASAATPTVALVGKGITFDSGGLSLKTAEGMMAMKTDMSGAADVLATLLACRRLQIAVRVRGYMPITENMPGGRAIKPGDVLKIRNGKTIEVLNTDAEGRLVLADALSLASEDEPDAIVDLATLTGACVVALGRSIGGLMGNDDRLIAALLDASREAGEAFWHLPLPAGYRAQVDSEIADMKNIGAPGQAGTLVAGLILEEFVDNVPWVHLDIAGPSRTDEDKGYLKKGATGFGVRTLIELLENYEPLNGLSSTPAIGSSVLR
jgi:leucyl aminopeptidase